MKNKNSSLPILSSWYITFNGEYIVLVSYPHKNKFVRYTYVLQSKYWLQKIIAKAKKNNYSWIKDLKTYSSSFSRVEPL